MNNIFKFATGELSQDAFLCWFFNWFKEGDNPKLKQLVCDFCKEKLGIYDLSAVDIYRQFSKKVEKEGQSFPVKIDVLLILNNEIAVIIEDKTFTSEHSSQIMRYEEGLRILQARDVDGKFRIENNAYKISKIISMYWKTGFFYDYDQRVVADKVIKADDLVEMLGKYRKENELLDMYVQKLLDEKEWYSDRANYWRDSDNNKETENYWETNLYKHQITQYYLMREVFPETMWDHKDLYYVYHGSSFGRPWTEITVYCNQEENYERAGGWFELFWRIDADSKGNYISLRLYKKEKGKWDSKYDSFKNRVKAFIESDGYFQWVDPGATRAYKEADIVHFTIDKEMWVSKGDQLKNLIRALTMDIVEYAKESYGSNGYE